MLSLTWYCDAASVLFALSLLWVVGYFVSFPIAAARRRRVDRWLGSYGMRRLPGESNRAAVTRLRSIHRITRVA